MKTAHDLIMELCAARETKEAAQRNRVKVNISERQRLIKESNKTDRFVSDYAELATPASKEAHRAYTEAAYKHRAAMRAINKYWKANK